MLVWRKRLWRCTEPLCPVKTWTEPSARIVSRAVLNDRARVEICRRVGEDADSVAQAARDYGVSWHTAIAAVREHGQGKVDDPARLEGVTALGMDKTAWLRANQTHHNWRLERFCSPTTCAFAGEHGAWRF